MFPTLDGAYPIVGHLPEMYRRFDGLCARGERAHGPLFFIEGGPGARQLMCTAASALTALASPAASTSFYSEGFGALLSNTLFAFDGAEHKHIRKMMAPAFTPGRIRKTDVLHIVSEVCSAHIQRWIREERDIRALAATKEVALEIIFRIIGVPPRDLSIWRRQFARYLLAGFPSSGRFRGPIAWLASRARDWLDARLRDHVMRLRRSGDDGTLLSAIAHSCDEAGELLDAALIVPNLRLLVLAGHETTASAMAWSLLHLAASEAHQSRGKEEASGADDLVALASDAAQMTFAEMQFREALRLYPAVHSVIRRVTGDLDLDVGTIPSGTLLNVPLLHLLRSPSSFDAPHRHRPERWVTRPRPGTVHTAMFGGGQHFCLGYHVAIAEGTLFNLHLARALAQSNLRLTLTGSLPTPIYLPLSHPPASAAVRFER